MKESRADSLCGRIYRDTSHKGGRTRTDYYVDCVDCSREDALEDVGRRRRAKTSAGMRGWTIDSPTGKWVCPDCTDKDRERVDG